MSRRASTAALFLLFGWGVLPSALGQTSAVSWITDLPMAQQMAAARNQLILVHFTSDDCLPCMRLEKNVYQDTTFAHGLSQQFVAVKINASQQPDLARHFRVEQWPTDIIFTSQGQELHRMITPQDRNEYLSKLRQIAWRHGTQPAAQLVNYAEKPPSTMGIHGLPDLGTPATGTQAATPRAASFPPAASALPAGNAPPAVNAPPGGPGGGLAGGGPYAAAPNPAAAGTPAYVAQTPTGNYAQMSNPQAAAMNSAFRTTANPPPAGRPTAGPSTAFAPASPSTGAVTPSQSTGGPVGQMISNPYVNPPNATGSPPAAGPVAGSYAKPPGDVARDATPRQPASTPSHPALSLRSEASPGSSALAGGLKLTDTPGDSSSGAAAASAQLEGSFAGFKLGMDGFCPVTLLTEDRWVQGDSKWGVRHRGRIYLFQSAAAQQKFLSDPDGYSPMLAGYDPVAFCESAEYREGRRAHGVRFRNRIYLFGSEESLQTFWSAPKKYAEVARQAMTAGPTYR